MMAHQLEQFEDGTTAFASREEAWHKLGTITKRAFTAEEALELAQLDSELVELKRCKSNGLCCGAGGAQMFKEAEKGNQEVNVNRTEEALETGAEIIAVNCPFCNTMMRDGTKHFEKEDQVQVLDIAEIVNDSLKS